eukprot:GHVS01014576.1.p1 GENE.GHVS01014576.1~~GHVS01014576.1.p1  ORF type:complete len:487 (+),score=113.12 GHVS01014576.1:38-1462(+)
MCSYFLKGKCKRSSDGCQFAHDQGDIRPLPNLSHTKLCAAVVQGLECTTPNCQYAHDSEDLKETQFEGTHKTVMCFFHKKGKCMNGDKCRFAHSVVDLRPKSPSSSTSTTPCSFASSPPPSPPSSLSLPPAPPPPRSCSYLSLPACACADQLELPLSSVAAPCDGCAPALLPLILLTSPHCEHGAITSLLSSMKISSEENKCTYSDEAVDETQRTAAHSSWADYSSDDETPQSVMRRESKTRGECSNESASPVSSGSPCGVSSDTPTGYCTDDEQMYASCYDQRQLYEDMRKHALESGFAKEVYVQKEEPSWNNGKADEPMKQLILVEQLSRQMNAGRSVYVQPADMNGVGAQMQGTDVQLKQQVAPEVALQLQQCWQQKVQQEVQQQLQRRQLQKQSQMVQQAQQQQLYVQLQQMQKLQAKQPQQQTQLQQLQQLQHHVHQQQQQLRQLQRVKQQQSIIQQLQHLRRQAEVER